MRLSQHTYFESLQNKAIYASLEHVRVGRLAAAVEVGDAVVWVCVLDSSFSIERSLVYELWSGWTQLLERLLSRLDKARLSEISSPFELQLDLSEVRNLSVEGQLEVVVDGQFDIDGVGKRCVRIRLKQNYLSLFSNKENDGEKSAVLAMARALGHAGVALDESEIQAIATATLGNVGARFLHLFASQFPVDHLLAESDLSLLLVDPADHAFERLGLSYECFSVELGELVGKERCNAALHTFVKSLWQRIRERLKRFDRRSVILKAVALHESIIKDRKHWSNTALALMSLYGQEDDVVSVAMARESDRNRAALAARTLIEMGVCETVLDGGKEISQAELGRLLALISLFIETAIDSDAITFELAPAKIQLFKNGEYEIDRRYQREIVEPFVSAYFSDAFNDAAADYGSLYDRSQAKSDRKRKAFDVGFTAAFLDEYGLTPEELVECVGECLDLALETEQVVVEIEMDALCRRIVHNRNVSVATFDSFLRACGLWSRPSWDKAPHGFCNKDLNPWRFRRRLSAVAKPVCVFGIEGDSTIIYGVASLTAGVMYLLQRAESGQLPGSFFSTQGMKKYIGAAVDDRGHRFAREIADILRSAGWKARNEVQMRELGAPPTEADGDLDVLAWKDSGDVLLIECKRLQMTRSVAEIAEICRKFKGEAKDELGKHLRRVNWILANPSSLQRIVGFVPAVECIDARLITNTHVPMRYLKDLPISADKIGPLQSDFANVSAEIGYV